MIEKVHEQMTEETQKVQGEIASWANNEGILYDYTKNLQTALVNDMKSVTTAVSGLSQAIQRMGVLLMQLNEDMYKKRVAISAFYKHAELLPHEWRGFMTPFLTFWDDDGDPHRWKDAPNGGHPPMTLDQRKALHKPSAAINASEVAVGWQDGTTAFVDRFHFACDPMYLLNYTIAAIDFRTLFYMLGPDAANVTCDSPAELGLPWFCRCAILHARDSCSMIADHEWPFVEEFNTYVGFPPDGHSDINTICQGSEVTRGEWTVVTSPGEWDTAFASWCSSISAGTAPVSGSVNKARVASPTTRGTVSLDMSGAKQCSVGQTLLNYNDTDIHQRLAYSVYYMWINGYAIVREDQMSRVNREVFGEMPADITYQQNMFSPDAAISRRSECDDFFYTQVYDDPLHPEHNKLPVYTVLPLDVKDSATVTLNNGAEYGVLREGVFIPAGPNNAYNVSVYSNAQVTTESQQLLPNVFYELGKWGNDPVLGPVVFDAPQALLRPFPTSQARAGSLMYVMEYADGPGVSDTSLLTLQDWKADFQALFDARSASESAYSYIRRYDALTRKCTATRYNGSAPNGGGTFEDDGTHEACNLLDKWRWSHDADGNLELTPREYEAYFQVEVPGSHLIQTVVSECPTNYSITWNDASGGSVTFYTDLTSAVQLGYQITSPDDPSCANPNGEFSMTASTPWTKSLSTCSGTYYINVWVLGSQDSCYPGDGISLKVTSHGISSHGLPPPVTHFVTQQSTGVAKAIGTLINAMAHLTVTINTAVYEHDGDLNAVRDAVNASISSLLNKTHGVSEQFRKQGIEMAKELEEYREQIEKQREALVKAGEMRDRINEQLAKEIPERDAAIAADNKALEDFKEESEREHERIQELDEAIDQYLDRCHPTVPIIGDAVCWVKGLIGSLTHGLGGFIQKLLYGILFIGLIVGLIMCAPNIIRCLRGTCKCCIPNKLYHPAFDASAPASRPARASGSQGERVPLVRRNVVVTQQPQQQQQADGVSGMMMLPRSNTWLTMN
eukprot:TRINITY_DN66000_c6_g11_i1.p1 TRINITY_DN66000_c6_g11~~TRINITY_DN66000_c6_g11_i1.p1  ORF type:complete len:1015 (+),score=528.47 TRINITY_DN66000_c6_g11_i1:398-3442(+)